MHTSPPSTQTGLFIALAFATWGLLVGTIARPIALAIIPKPPAVPRAMLTTVVLWVLITLQIGGSVARFLQTTLMYHQPLREANWPYVWGITYAICFGLALMRGPRALP